MTLGIQASPDTKAPAASPLPRTYRASQRRLVWRALAVVITLAAFAATGAGLWVRSQLRASLPRLDGTVALAQLSAPVVIERDAQGIPTIRGRSRLDVARATGFLHAQDRFFQMDLARRRGAGELSALVGARALEADREIRIHRFRAVARQAVSLTTDREREMLEAYADGVNAGLRALGASPFEYLVLRQTPEPWKPEDTFLVVLSMFVTLQESDGAYEATLATMHAVLPPAMFELLAPRGTEWDAPVEGPAFRVAPVPGPDVYDLRARRRNKPPVELTPEREQARDFGRTPLPAARRGADRRSLTRRTGGAFEGAMWGGDAIGSNSWVVSGAHTSDGRPLVANDMHLVVRVPNTWYRAVLEWSDVSASGPPISADAPSSSSRDASGPRRLVGVTLPGTPALVVGSNSHVAWGFTNTYADWSDIVLLDVDPSNANRYRTPEGWRDFERFEEVIRVAGEADERLDVTWTIWGPEIGPDHMGRPRAYRWVAHAPDRLARTLAPFENARTIGEAFESANGLGAPGQNLVVADRDGHIGWSIYGAIPRRSGLDGRLPTSWSDGARGWNGWLTPAEFPRIVDPPSGRIWTANARVAGGRAIALLGDGNYEVGSRATIVRDRLMAKPRLSPQDLVDIQLDTSARFLDRWRELAVRSLGASALARHPDRALFRDLVDKGWSGHASPDSVAYRLTRAFRDAVTQRVIEFVLVECYDADPSFDYFRIRRREGPVWKLVTERPHHLLDPRYPSWDHLLWSAVDDVIDEAGGDLRELAWSRYNITEYRHPLSGALPFAGRWLDMPSQALAGDLFTPNMHWGSAAPSERMIVSPGREDEGLMQMPTGQSGHPLSPFYASSHEAWVKGAPTPLMPGPPTHMLTLEPGTAPR